MYEWHLEETLKRFLSDSKGFAKDVEVAEINRAVVEMANNFNQGVGDDDSDIGELLDVVPEESTDEELEVEYECRAEEAREKKTEDKDPPAPNQ